MGQQVLDSLTPGQQVIKIVNEELTDLMGATDAKITFASEPPTVIMPVSYTHLLGDGRAERQEPAGRQDGGYHLRRHREAPAPVLLLSLIHI